MKTGFSGMHFLACTIFEETHYLPFPPKNLHKLPALIRNSLIILISNNEEVYYLILLDSMFDDLTH